MLNRLNWQVAPVLSLLVITAACHAWQPPLPTGVELTIGDATWNFNARNGKNGIAGAYQKGEESKSFTLEFDGAIGEVIGIAGGGYNYPPESWKENTRRRLAYMCLAVASWNREKTHIEYRMLFGRGDEDIFEDKGWIYSRSLITRLPEESFTAMSATMLGGDSAMLTLNRLSREDRNNDTIETRVFVNHCPGGLRDNRMMMTIVAQYAYELKGNSSGAVAAKVIPTTPFQPTPHKPKDQR